MLAFLLSACTHTLGEGFVFDPPDPNRFGERNGLEIYVQNAVDADGNPLPPRRAPFLEHEWIETKAGRVAVSTLDSGKVDYRFRDSETGELTSIRRVSADQPFLLHCGGRQADRVGDFGKLTSLGIFGDAAAWDYPGYGDSDGEAGVASLDAAADDVLAWAVAKAGTRALVLWGHSLGAFVCADLAKRSDAVDALVIEAGAPSLARTAEVWSRRIPLVTLRSDPTLGAYDIPRALASWDKPLLVLGTTKDNVLPVQLSRELAGELGMDGVSRRYIEIEDEGHNTVIRNLDILTQTRDWMDTSGLAVSRNPATN